jgi:RNA polymerase sigma factor (sigma-70 family)
MSLPPFQSLLDAYADDVARLLRSLVGPDEADDCAQETWLSALRAYPSLRNARNLRGWLLTIAARKATDAHRSRGRRAAPVEHLPEQTVPDSWTCLPDQTVWRAVRGLPDGQRAAVVLRHAMDLSYAEVAATLGCTPAAARRRVADAIATLREQI